MSTNSAVATFTIAPLGLFRLDATSLRVITPADPDPDLYPLLEQLAARAFLSVSGHHTSVAESYDLLPRAMNLPVDNFHLISLTEPTPPPELPEGVIS